MELYQDYHCYWPNLQFGIEVSYLLELSPDDYEYLAALREHSLLFEENTVHPIILFTNSPHVLVSCCMIIYSRIFLATWVGVSIQSGLLIMNNYSSSLEVRIHFIGSTLVHL